MKKILAKLKSLWANDFARHNTILFVGNTAVAFVNYLYYPVLGRLLDTAQFGEVQALVSVFLQAGLFLQVISNVSVNVVANEKDPTKRNRFVLEMERASLAATLLVVVAALCFVGPIQRFLQFDDIVPFLLLGASMVLSASVALRGAYLRGLLAFGKLSVANLITAVGKLIVSAILVALSFGTAGAIGGLVAAQVIAYFYIRHSAGRLGLKPPKGDTWKRLPEMQIIRPYLRYAGLVAVVSLASTLLFSVDSIIIKHYFNAQTAGEYAGVATTARIIFFLTGSIAMVLLSSVKLETSAGDNRRLLIKSALVQAVLGGATLAFFALWPQFTISLLLGDRYLPLANLLPELSLAMFLLAFVNLIFSYDVALRRASVAIYALLGLGLTFAAVLVHHGTPRAVIDCLVFGAVVMLVLRALDSLRRLDFKNPKNLIGLSNKTT